MRDKWEEFLRNPKQMMAAMFAAFGVSVSFLWNVWEADSWQEAVVCAAIALCAVFAAGHLLARVEKFFSPRPVLWLSARERQLLKDVADHKACGAPYLRDNRLYVCQVPPHTDGVNHIGLKVLDVSVEDATMDMTTADGTFEVHGESDR